MCRAGLHIVSRSSSGLGHHPFTMGITGSNPVRDTRGSLDCFIFLACKKWSTKTSVWSTERCHGLSINGLGILYGFVSLMVEYLIMDQKKTVRFRRLLLIALVRWVGRVADCVSLENWRPSRVRGFESLTHRNRLVHVWILSGTYLNKIISLQNQMYVDH